MAANNIYIQVDFNSQTAQQNVNALNQAIAQTGPTATKSAEEATKGLGSVNVSVQQTMRGFTELSTVLAGLGIERMVSRIVQVSSELGRAQQMMTYFTGSADEARKVFEQIRALADQTPFSYPDLEKAGQRLAGFGMQAKEIVPTLKALSDQVAAMGGSIEDVNSMVTIFGRLMGKDFVSAMDLIRKLPAEGVRVMDALRDALSKRLGMPVAVEDVEKFMKLQVLGPLDTWRAIMQGMQSQTRGAASMIRDFAQAFKVLGDRISDVWRVLVSDQGFGRAFRAVADELRPLLALFAAFIDFLIKLPEPVKEALVNLALLVPVVIAFGGAWKAFTLVAPAAITAITGIGNALKTAFLFLLENPELLAIGATVAAFAYGFTQIDPKDSQKIADWAKGVWKKVQDGVAQAAKASGIFPEALGDTKLTPPGADIALVNAQKSLDAVQAQIDDWKSSAAKSLLTALSSPAEAVEIKYRDLLDKLNTMMKEKLVQGPAADAFRQQLDEAKTLEMQSKLWDAQKKHIDETAKYNEERTKGSYEAQIAYIESLDEQDLRKKVANIDRITELRVQSAREVAKIEDDALQQQYDATAQLFKENQKAMGLTDQQVQEALTARHQEMADKQQVIDQKAADEIQKYRLEGWKKANDAIIEDQKRIYESFKSMFDDIFDAFTQHTKSIGQALGDVFKKLALEEVRGVFSSTAAGFATQLAGFGRPEETGRGGGILSMLLGGHMAPRPPGPPPESYTPARSDTGIHYAGEATNRFNVGVDAFDQATVRFALAVGHLEGASSSQGEASRSMDESASSMSEASTAIQQASAATGVDPGLLRAMATVESGMRPGAVSPKGAQGLFQLMPATQQDWGVTQPFSPFQSAMGGAQQIKRLLSRYGGDVGMALAAYNYGPTNFDRAMAQGRALPAETTNYVKQVKALMTQGAVADTAGPYNVGLLDSVTTYGGYEGGYSPVGGYSPISGLGGAVTAGATPITPEMRKQASVLASLGGVLGTSVGRMGGGGGTQPAGLGGLLNVAKLRDLFGIGGAAGGGTTIGSVAGSQGVANLAGLAGMALIATGLNRRVAPVTVAGGALAGVQLGRQLGMTPFTGAVMGTGLGLAAAGVQQGGFGGLGMTTAGGALAGAAIGTQIAPGVGTLIGAGIGAAAGLITGVVRLFVKTEQEKIRAQVKQVYGIDISNRQILTQIQQIVDQSYGGNVAVGIRSNQVMDLVRLYALSTGQAANMPRPMYNAMIAQGTQGLQLQPVYQGGVQVQTPYTGTTTYQYQTAVAAAGGLLPGFQAGSGLGVPGAQGIINQGWQQLALATIQGNPSAIAMASAAAARAGDSRLTNTAAMQEPLTALG